MHPKGGEEVFDEELYRKANPDVEAAVRSGACRSGLHHYKKFGKRECRPLRPAADFSTPPLPEDADYSRRDIILAGLDLSELRGVEIGALCSPIVSIAEGDISYVDHADTKSLKAKYADDPAVNTDLIVEVDGVWGENTLLECVGGDFDYVVASHVIEHVPDLANWLQEIHAILKPGGRLRLAIPDRRYTFDYYRHESRLHDVLDAYLQKARRPLPRLILEHFNMARPVDTYAIWRGQEPDPFMLTEHQARASLAIARDALLNGSYHDAHCWVFTPFSFRQLMTQLALLDLLPFTIDQIVDTRPNSIEFFAHLIAV
jgi:SAM-dependent methyltransferase